MNELIPWLHQKIDAAKRLAEAAGGANWQAVQRWGFTPVQAEDMTR